MRKSTMTRQKLERKILKRFEKIVKLCNKYDDMNYLSLSFVDGHLSANNNYYDEDVKTIYAWKEFGEKEIYSFERK